MLKIKALDEENIKDICSLNSDDNCHVKSDCFTCIAFYIAKAKCNADQYVNAIYYGSQVIGYFIYERSEDSPNVATITHFDLLKRFKSEELEKMAIEYIVRGLKFQGVKKIFIENVGNEMSYLFSGFHLAERKDKQYCYELDI